MADNLSELREGAVSPLRSRTVVAFLSDNHLDPDIAIESFVLEPQPTGAVPASTDA